MGAVCLREALDEAAEAVSRPDRPCIRPEIIDPALIKVCVRLRLTT